MNSDQNQGGTGRNKKKLSREEAEQAIRDLVAHGATYREVSQVEFNVEGRLKHFSISEISRIINSESQKNKPPSVAEGALDAEMFRLFELGKGPTYAVIKLHIPAEKAESTYKRYLSMKEGDLSNPSIPRRLKELEKRLDDFDVIQRITDQIRGPYFESELENAPDCTDIYVLLNSAKDLNALPISNLGRATCSHCGSKGYYSVNFRCNCCDNGGWWGRAPKK